MPRTLTGVAVGAAALLVPVVSPPVLTGSTTPIKDWAIAVVDALHGMNPWFSVVVIVLVGGLVGRIGDRMASQRGRRRPRRASR